MLSQKIYPIHLQLIHFRDLVFEIEFGSMITKDVEIWGPDLKYIFQVIIILLISIIFVYGFFVDQPTSWLRRETMKLCQQKLSHRCCIIILLYGISVQMCGNYCVGVVIPYWPDYLLLICGASSHLTQESRDSSDQCSSSVMCRK